MRCDGKNYILKNYFLKKLTKFSLFNFMILRFKAMWLAYKKNILKFVDMVLMLHISSNKMNRHFN